MLSFTEYLKENAADLDAALKNFILQMINSGNSYASLHAKITGGKVMTAAEMYREYPEYFDGNIARWEKNDHLMYVVFNHGGFVVSVDKNSGDIVDGKVYFYGDATNVIKGFRWQEVKHEKHFEKVTVYTTGEFMGNVHRRDMNTLTIRVGKYAQYHDAINLIYKQKGKQKMASQWISYDPFVVVVPTAKAINPDDMMGASEPGSTPGVSISRSRYSSFDDRWRSDFMAKLKAAHVPILWSHEDRGKMKG